MRNTLWIKSSLNSCLVVYARLSLGMLLQSAAAGDAFMLFHFRFLNNLRNLKPLVKSNGFIIC